MRQKIIEQLCPVKCRGLTYNQITSKLTTAENKKTNKFYWQCFLCMAVIQNNHVTQLVIISELGENSGDPKKMHRPQIRVYFYIVYILFTTLHAHMFRIIKCNNNVVISFSKIKEQQKKKK